MKNTSRKTVTEAVVTGRIVYDKNPDRPMYYFEFAFGGKCVFLSYKMLVDSLYFGIENKNFLKSYFHG